MTAMKRQASYFYAHTHNDDADSASNKRRRQNEEFQYTATTIQTAPMSILTGRREPALPLVSVDMERTRVLTSSEFDREEAEMAAYGDDRTQEDQQQVEEKNDEAQDDDDPNGDVASMYMMASLIQSTRHYYSFASDDTTSTTKSLSNNMSSKDQTNISQAYSNCNNNYNTERTPSEDNSDGLSSWTPSSSSCNDYLNDNDKKHIDDDNRSDGQSSCDIGAGESWSDSISNSDHGSSPYPYSPRRKGEDLHLGSIVSTTLEGSFFIVG